MIWSKKLTVLATFFIVTTILIIYYHVPNTRTQILYSPRQRMLDNKTKSILYYTKMFDDMTFYLGEGKQIFQHCPVKDCFATHDRNVMPIDQFDALMFHANQFNPFGQKVPQKRSTHQVYIWVNMESPSNSINYKTTDFYNWSMTYRMDSDLPRPYGATKKGLRNYTLPTIESIEKRPKKIAWMVSNCRTSSARLQLAQAIGKLMHVDIFGTCGIYNCPKKEGEKCFRSIAGNYKFYLAFENSVCKDYVTEKFFRTLQYDIVPIVYGGANYSMFAPPHSFIDASNFESVELLVKYLKELDEDPKKYLEYFEWKKRYYVVLDNDDMLCRLCQKLHEPIRRNIYSDIGEWYAPKGACKYRDTLPEIVADLI